MKWRSNIRLNIKINFQFFFLTKKTSFLKANFPFIFSLVLFRVWCCVFCGVCVFCYLACLSMFRLVSKLKNQTNRVHRSYSIRSCESDRILCADVNLKWRICSLILAVLDYYGYVVWCNMLLFGTGWCI